MTQTPDAPVIRLDRCLLPIDIGDYIRVGGPNDGGYILLNGLLDQCDGLLSAGVSSDWRFERECKAINPALTIKAYDPSVDEKHFRREYLAHVAMWFLLKTDWRSVGWRLYRWLDYRSFFRGKRLSGLVRRFMNRTGLWIENPACFTGTAEHLIAPMTVGNIRQILNDMPGQKLFVKIDIDGSEYDLVPMVLEHADRILGIAFEFHFLSQRPVVETMRLLSERYAVIWVHANNFLPPNPDGSVECIEFTMVRKDVLPKTSYPGLTELPHRLDDPNNPYAKDYRITFGV